MKRKNKKSLISKAAEALSVAMPMVLIATALTVVIGYSFFFIKDVQIPTVLPVSEVAVIGELRFQDKTAVKNIVKNNINGGYFTVDLNKIRDSLLQQPWIKNVSLRRRWPSNLDVIITEQVPVAYWNHDGYISSSGEVFKPEKTDRHLNLPALNGPDGLHDNVWQFMNVLYQELALLNFEVVQLELDDRRSWQLLISKANVGALATDNSKPISVKLGRYETQKRLQRFVRILPSLIAGYDVVNTDLSSDSTMANNEIKVIDMRYPNGFSVQRAAVPLTTMHRATAFWTGA